MRTVMRYLLIFISLGILSVVLAGCQSPSMKNEVATDALVGSMWRLSSLAERANTDAAATTLHFENAGRLTGSDGCNSYQGSYNASNSTLEIADNMMSTMMACPQPVELQASAFKRALKNTMSFKINDGQLQLQGDKGQLLATFAAVSQSLSGTSWEVVGYNNGKQGVVSVLSGSQITVSFGEDGKVTGSAGCNRYFASYQQTGGELNIGSPGATRMFCAEPKGLMEQEQHFLAALQKAKRYQLDGDQLTLRTHERAIAVRLSK